MATGEKGNRWIDPRFRPLRVGATYPFLWLNNGQLMGTCGNGVTVSSDRGQTWSSPHIIAAGDGPGVPDLDPNPQGPSNPGALLQTRSGAIVLVFRDHCVLNWDSNTGEPGEDGRGDVWAIRSLDCGSTWTDRVRIFEGICGHPPINLIQTTSGRLVTTVQFYLRHPGRNAIRVYSSSDDGKTWRGSSIIDLGGHGHHDGGFEPTFVQLKDGRLWMLIRTTLDRYWEAFSEDDGLSWRTIRPSNIEASTSPAYLTRLSSGRLLLAWNQLYPQGATSYMRRGGQFSEANACWHREELSLAFSEDDGATWSKPVIIAREKDTWISYPYVFEYMPGRLWIVTMQGHLMVCANEDELLS